MTVINFQPVGRDGMTPRQWHTVREMILQVARTAVYLDDLILLFRANAFLLKTEVYDV